MGLVIIYSGIARADLKEIYSYIRKNSARYALLEVKSIRSAIQKLKLNALIGKKFEKWDDEHIRGLVFKNYMIVYEISDKHIVILTIHHHSRLIANNPAFLNDE